MSASWFTADTFFGIIIPLESIKPLHRRLIRSRFEFRVIEIHLIESLHPKLSSGKEHARSRGFLGFVWGSSLVDDLLEMEKIMGQFIRENTQLLRRFGIIEHSPSWMLGIRHDICKIWDQLPDYDKPSPE